MMLIPDCICSQGLVEKRTKAIVPVVMDLLNLVVGTDNHYKALGGYTFEFADYLEVHVHLIRCH